MCDGRVYGSAANVWRQWRAQRVHCTPGLGGPWFGRQRRLMGYAIGDAHRKTKPNRSR